MSVYNGGRHLSTAIESILGQTFRDFELLIINDASTDNSRKIIQSYDDSRIRLLDNQERMGLTRSLNRGLREAQGSLVARMDADDVSLPGRLATQVKTMERAQADVCFCRVVFEDKTSGKEWVWHETEWELVRWRALFRNSYGIHPASMFKRDVILAIGGYDERFPRAQDYDLWDRCVVHNLKFVYTQEPLLRYRLHIQGVSRTHLADQELYARQISFRAMRRFLPDASVDELEGLRWLFRQREPDVEDRTILAGLYRCEELVPAFLQTCESRHSRAVWNDVAVCLASRLREMDNPSRWAALRAILPAIKHAQSARCIIQVMRAFYNSIRKQR